MLSPLVRLTALASLLTLVGCNAPQPTPVDAKQVEAETGAAVEAEADAPAGPKIASDEATFEFGEVRPGEVVEHTFTIKNEGRSDLHIERVQRT